MRTYLIDDEQNEIIVDLTRTKVHDYNLVEFDYSTLEDNTLTNEQTIWVKKVSGQYFVSPDQIHWKKIPRQDLPSRMINVNKTYNIYRGYKPSGLGGADEGELLTKMPGKVVKIMAEIGQEVEKGQTLLILEAMKMENEIKSGIDGVVKAIHVNEGDALEENVVMLEVEAK
jgi:biotin carboxyl carrier protein